MGNLLGGGGELPDEPNDGAIAAIGGHVPSSLSSTDDSFTKPPPAIRIDTATPVTSMTATTGMATSGNGAAATGGSARSSPPSLHPTGSGHGHGYGGGGSSGLSIRAPHRWLHALDSLPISARLLTSAPSAVALASAPYDPTQPAHQALTHQMLARSPALVRLRASLVPSKMSDAQFWRNVFGHVWVHGTDLSATNGVYSAAMTATYSSNSLSVPPSGGVAYRPVPSTQSGGHSSLMPSWPAPALPMTPAASPAATYAVSPAAVDTDKQRLEEMVANLQRQVERLTVALNERDAALAAANAATAAIATATTTAAADAAAANGETKSPVPAPPVAAASPPPLTSGSVTRCICRRCDRTYWHASPGITLHLPPSTATSTGSDGSGGGGRAEAKPDTSQCYYHKGTWQIDERSRDFPMFPAELKANLRAEKQKRLKRVHEEMRWIPDDDNNWSLPGKWTCCGQKEYWQEPCTTTPGHEPAQL